LKPRALWRHGKTALRDDPGLRRLCLYLGLLGFLAIGYLAFILTLPPPDIWATLVGASESLSFTTVNPDMAAFHANGMRAVAIDGGFDACVDALIVPRTGARIEYRHGDNGFFRITLDPPASGGPAASIRDLGQGAPTVAPAGSLILSATSDCSGAPPLRLPIWGAASFGEETRPVGPSGEIAPGVMIEAKLSVFARSHARLLGVGFPAVVYPVTSFELPAGSVLELPETARQAGDIDMWTGLAFVDKQKAAFQIEATTRTHEVILKSPRALALSAHGSERLDLGKYAQFLSDPNVIQIQVVVGVFLFLAQSMLSIVGFFGRHVGQKGKVG
jgi:hypothetical protein